MTPVQRSNDKIAKASLIFVLVSILLCMLLFYIDEGYNDFRWMKDLGNWIAFAIYSFSIIITQLAIYIVLARYIPHRVNVLLSAFIGPSLALLILIGVIFS